MSTCPHGKLGDRIDLRLLEGIGDHRIGEREKVVRVTAKYGSAGLLKSWETRAMKEKLGEGIGDRRTGVKVEWVTEKSCENDDVISHVQIVVSLLFCSLPNAQGWRRRKKIGEEVGDRRIGERVTSK